MFAGTARWIRDQIAFLVVVGVLAASFVYLLVQSGRWGRTSGGVSVALLLAGLLRAVLPARFVGMLAIRSRVVDTITYLLLGGVILIVDIRLHN